MFDGVTPKTVQEINQAFVFSEEFKQIDCLESIIRFINKVTTQNSKCIDEAKIQKDVLQALPRFKQFYKIQRLITHSNEYEYEIDEKDSLYTYLCI